MSNSSDQPTSSAAAFSRTPYHQKERPSERGASLANSSAFFRRSLLLDPEEQILPSSTAELPKSSDPNQPHYLKQVSSNISPFRTPVQQSGCQISIPDTPCPVLPLQISLRGADNTISPAPNPPLPEHAEAILITNHESVLENAENPILRPERSPEKHAMASKMTAPAALMTAKTGGSGLKPMNVESGVLRCTAMRKVEFGLRVLEFVFCLISFSVMAADRTTGWAGDSFDRYQEFRYCISMNIIAFVYSGYQVLARFHHVKRRRCILDRSSFCYMDFCFDQVLAYLLMSASSSAAARNDGWISMFGSDKFTDMVNGSIAMSFLAFLAFALSSIISANKLFSSSH